MSHTKARSHEGLKGIEKIWRLDVLFGRAQFAAAAGRSSATDHDWDDMGGLRHPQPAPTGLTEGLGTAFPQKGVPNRVRGV